MVLYCMYCSIDLSPVTKQLRRYHYFRQHGMQLAELEWLNISPMALYHEPFQNPVPGEPITTILSALFLFFIIYTTAPTQINIFRHCLFAEPSPFHTVSAICLVRPLPRRAACVHKLPVLASCCARMLLSQYGPIFSGRLADCHWLHLNSLQDAFHQLFALCTEAPMPIGQRLNLNQTYLDPDLFWWALSAHHGCWCWTIADAD